MSWEHVAAVVRESFAVVIEGDGWVGVAHESAKVKVLRTVVLGRPFVAVIGDVFEVGILDPVTILQLNHALPIGALEDEDGRLLLRAMLPLAGLDDVDLRRVVLHVGRQTAHLQSKRTEGAHAVALLHYVD